MASGRSMPQSSLYWWSPLIFCWLSAKIYFNYGAHTFHTFSTHLSLSRAGLDFAAMILVFCLRAVFRVKFTKPICNTEKKPTSLESLVASYPGVFAISLVRWLAWAKAKAPRGIDQPKNRLPPTLRILQFWRCRNDPWIKWNRLA